MQGFWDGFEKQAKKSEKKDHKKYDLLRHVGSASLGGLAGAGMGSFTSHPKGKHIGAALGALVGSRAYRHSEGM